MIASSIKSVLIRWSGPTSIKTVVAPICSIAATDAIYELGTVITSSPRVTPRATNEKINASVPLLTEVVYFTPNLFAIRSSKASIIGCSRYIPLSKTSDIFGKARSLIDSH